MVEIPDDVASLIATELRLRRNDVPPLSDDGYRGVCVWADLLDPPKPPPTLVEQMLETWYGTTGDSVTRMYAVKSVVSAAVEELDTDMPKWDVAFHNGWDAAQDAVLDLLGGEGGCG